MTTEGSHIALYPGRIFRVGATVGVRCNLTPSRAPIVEHITPAMVNPHRHPDLQLYLFFTVFETRYDCNRYVCALLYVR